MSYSPENKKGTHDITISKMYISTFSMFHVIEVEATA